MKYFSSLLLLLLLTSTAWGQTVTIDENFSDGDFTNNPSWTDAESKHIVNGSNLLQLDAPAVDDEAVISTSSTAAYGEWEALINMDFATSSTSLSRFYILSDTESMKGAVEGYYIQVGDTDDEVSLYLQEGNKTTKLIDGTDSFVGSSSVTVRVKATRDVNGNWELFADASGGTSFTSQGTASDNTVATSSFIGLFSKYIDSRSTDFTYDDIKVTKVNPPLDVQNVTVIDNQTIDVSFNLDVDPATVQASDFDIDPIIGSPNNASAANNIVQLTFNDALVGGEYTLNVDNIDDDNGNTINPNTTFQFQFFNSYADGDVKINEFLAGPSDTQTEYVELINTSNKYLNLANWEIGDATGPNPLGSDSIPLAPNGFIVISSDTTALFNIFGSHNYYDFGLASLNNSGDVIELITDTGAKADSLTYDSDWVSDEVALERRSPTAPSTASENWADSPNLNGGTPGFANEVETDRTPPFFEELYAIDATKLQLVFSEKITSSSATDKQNYQITPNRNIQLVIAKEDSVQLVLSQELESEQTYKATASNISDIFGNTLSGATRETTYLRIDEAQSRDIVINEIMYNPGSDEADFVELYNASNKNIDLNNWEVGDASSDATITGNTQLLAGGYLLLTGSDIFASSTSNALDVSGFPALNSSTPDAVYLRNDEGQTIDSLRYSQSWGGSEDGTSLERKDPNAASNDASNWQTSSANSGYSAGAQNAVFQEDESPPEVIFAKALINGEIEVRFNEFIQLTNDLAFLQDGQELTIQNFDPINGNVVTLTKPTAKKYSVNGAGITVRNLSDVKGNTTQNSEVAIAQPMEPAEIVINEIMFNPLDDPDDNKADQGEYIELRNTQDHAVSLEGLYLHDAPDEDGEVRDLQPVASTAKWVPAQGKVLIHADPTSPFPESKVANFFDLTSPDLQSVMRIDRSSLSLASSDDAIFISDSTGATIDSVFYDESWHNPNIIDSRGIALERISPGGPSDDDSNWGSSVNSKGGTPNKENSLYQENAQQQDENGISFNPNPFSPDNDGYEDNLFINYKLDQQDYLMKVRIYDRYGRLVCKLADGERAGFDGQLIWNGRKDDGSRNRIGIYIVVFEAYDSTTGADKSFKKTVVLARKLN